MDLTRAARPGPEGRKSVTDLGPYERLSNLSDATLDEIARVMQGETPPDPKPEPVVPPPSREERWGRISERFCAMGAGRAVYLWRVEQHLKKEEVRVAARTSKGKGELK
jgi:hypothetical protein